MSESEDEFVTVAEAARALGIDARQVRRYAARLRPEDTATDPDRTHKGQPVIVLRLSAVRALRDAASERGTGQRTESRDGTGVLSAVPYQDRNAAALSLVVQTLKERTQEQAATIGQHVATIEDLRRDKESLRDERDQARGERDQLRVQLALAEMEARAAAESKKDAASLDSTWKDGGQDRQRGRATDRSDDREDAAEASESSPGNLERSRGSFEQRRGWWARLFGRR